MNGIASLVIIAAAVYAIIRRSEVRLTLLLAEEFGAAVVLEGEGDGGDGFVEEADEGGPAGDGLLVEDLFLRLAEVVGSPGPLLLQIMPVTPEPGRR